MAKIAKRGLTLCVWLIFLYTLFKHNQHTSNKNPKILFPTKCVIFIYLYMCLLFQSSVLIRHVQVFLLSTSTIHQGKDLWNKQLEQFSYFHYSQIFIFFKTVSAVK